MDDSSSKRTPKLNDINKHKQNKVSALAVHSPSIAAVAPPHVSDPRERLLYDIML